MQKLTSGAFEVLLRQLAFANLKPASRALKLSRTMKVNQCDSDSSADSIWRESVVRSLNV